MEKLKLKYQILKDKLLLFSAMFSGSFIGLFKYENIYASIILLVGMILATLGVVKNFHNIKILEKDLKDA